MNPKEILGWFLVVATAAGIIYMVADAIGWRDTFKVLVFAIGTTGAIVTGVYLITGTI